MSNLQDYVIDQFITDLIDSDIETHQARSILYMHVHVHVPIYCRNNSLEKHSQSIMISNFSFPDDNTASWFIQTLFIDQLVQWQRSQRPPHHDSHWQNFRRLETTWSNPAPPFQVKTICLVLLLAILEGEHHYSQEIKVQKDQTQFRGIPRHYVKVNFDGYVHQ